MGKVKGKAAKTLKKKVTTTSRSKRPFLSDALFGPLASLRRSPSRKKQRQQQKQQQQQQQHSPLFHRSTSFTTSRSASCNKTPKKRNNNNRKGPPSRSSSFVSNISSAASVQVHLPNDRKDDGSNVPWLREQPQVQPQQQQPTERADNDNKKRQAKRQRNHSTSNHSHPPHRSSHSDINSDIDINNHNHHYPKKCRLPIDDIPLHWLQRLDMELQAFANYVQLSNDEILVRQAVVQEMEITAQQVFASTTCCPQQHKRWNCNGDLQQQKQQQQQTPVGFQIFGSFATPAVCVFTSDVDLALHGVVPPLPELTSAAAGAGAAQSSPSPQPPPQQQQTPKHPNKRQQQQQQQMTVINNTNKQERILRWKQALAAMEEDNLAAPSPAESSNSVHVGVAVRCRVGGEYDNNNNDDDDDDNNRSHNDNYIHKNNDDLYRMDCLKGNGATSLSEPQAGKVDCQTQAASATTATATASQNNMDDTRLPLFVIDRVGVVEPDAIKTDKSPNAAANSSNNNDDDDDDDGDNNNNTNESSKQIRQDSDETVNPNENTSLHEQPPVAFVKTSLDNNNDDDDDAFGTAANADDSDNDSADKLERFLSSKSTVPDTLDHVADDKPAVSLSDSDDSSVDDSYHKHNDGNGNDIGNNASNDEMEVSYISNPTSCSTSNMNNNCSRSIGPTGYIRMQVVSALSTLSNKLRKSSKTKKVTLIKTARVPIAKVETNEGIEIDIAVGGHNGTDTSHFAAKQMEKYESFATVVLFLKVLLNQQKLDIPFMGGLGSYKLYVMVAYHIQQHMALGGEDRPGEVLLTFLFRYGCVNGHNVDDQARTRLEQHVPLQYTPDCFADLSNVRHLDHIVHLFRKSFMRLWKHVNICIQQEKKNSPSSSSSRPGLLACLIHKDRLRAERVACLQRMKALCYSDSKKKKKRAPEPSLPRATKRSHSSISNIVMEVQNQGDLSEEELMKGYGVTREQLELTEQANAKKERGTKGLSCELAELRAAKRLRSDSNSDIAAKNWNDLSAEELMQGYGVTREQLEWVGHHKI